MGQSTIGLEARSVKKKLKNVKFAAGCSRDVICRGADMLGWSLDELLCNLFYLCTMNLLAPEKTTSKSNDKKPLTVSYYPQLMAFLIILIYLLHNHLPIIP